ncbi:membrane protein [Arthrobacter phage Kittykat]|uniref:Membrane protein n=1 Tax=Arthrobacter phage Kittykat TaxID=2794944 RepID=A0A7T1NWT1_9CAUD|nr:membrane protein [Arthrobacter phage Kittykat]QPO16970.1 membrane protein [Arthrobacter phage Kittykat]
MTRVWQLMGLAGVAVAGLMVGVLVPDSLILVLYLVAFFAILMAYSRWKDLRREREQQESTSEAEFHRLYTRYTVARQRAYTDYLDSTNAYTGQEFEFPSFAEWREEGRAQIN